MKRSKPAISRLATLKIFALLVIFPGLAGLIVSAIVSTNYLETLPKSPTPLEQRLTPRNVHGVVVYQTKEEDEHLSSMEYTSVAVFLVGLVLGVVYLEKWSARQRRPLSELDLLKKPELRVRAIEL